MTNKQEMFVKEYLIDFNATRAALEAGYSKDTAYAIGNENLKKLEIKEAIDKAIKERSEKTDITAEYVIQGIKEVIENATQDSNKLKGFELLGKHLALFTDVNKLTGSLAVENSQVDKLVQSIDKAKTK